MTTEQASMLVQTLSPFAVFRRRDFALMWSGQLVDTIGSSLTSLAASILIFRETGSAASVGLMLIAAYAPGLLFGLIAGVFVDRYDRKRIMIASSVIRAVLVLLIPFLVPLNIAWLYILVALSSTVGQFYDPAHESVLPEVAHDDELAAANSLMAISSFGSTAIGFAAAGLLASLGSIAWAFYLDAVTFLLSGLFIAFIEIKPLIVEDKTSVSVVMRNLRSGLRYLFDTPILRSLFWVSIPVLISFGLTNSILLPFATEALGMSEFQFGIQEGVTSLGFVAGSLILAAIAGRLYEGQWITIGYIGMGILGIAYSQSSVIPVAMVILFFSGAMNAPASIARRLIVQRQSPREMRGRVNSAFFVSRDILFLIGMGGAVLGDVVDLRLLYFIASAIIVVSGLLAQFLPGLRHGAAEWRDSLQMLRAAPIAPGLDAGRLATPADLDRLIGYLPRLGGLSADEREHLLRGARVVEAPPNTAVIRYGDDSDAAYFVLEGAAFAGLKSDGGNYRSLEIHKAGDFFGEIAALTGSRRTADVIITEQSTLLQVSSQALRGLMSNPVVGPFILSKMTERLANTNVKELPRFAGYDQREVRELRTAEPEG